MKIGALSSSQAPIKLQLSAGAFSSPTSPVFGATAPNSPTNNSTSAPCSPPSSASKLSLTDGGRAVLEQSRTGKTASQFMQSEQYGVHFDPVSGSCTDVALVRVLLSFMSSMKLSVYDATEFAGVTAADANNSLNAAALENMNYQKKCVAEYEFFSDALTLLNALSYKYIEEAKMTYRYVGVQCQRFVSASDTRARQGVMGEMSQVISGTRKLNFAAAPTTNTNTITNTVNPTNMPTTPNNNNAAHSSQPTFNFNFNSNFNSTATLGNGHTYKSSNLVAHSNQNTFTFRTLNQQHHDNSTYLSMQDLANTINTQHA